MATNKRRRTNINKDNNYEAFLKQLSLMDLGLISSSSQFDPAAYMKMRSNKTEVPKISIEAGYHLEEADKMFFESTAKFKLTIQGQKTGTRPVVIECAFLGHFHCKPPTRKELAQRFTEFEFRVIVWPYFRNFVQDITARMSIPPVVIPLSVEATSS
jgi:preprotein translocase subunit SecB